MKNNNINLGLLIGVVIVVAVVASVISAGITGNVIKVNSDRFGKYNVYTMRETYNKSEVDAKGNLANCYVLYSLIYSQMYEIANERKTNDCNSPNSGYNSIIDVNKDGSVNSADLAWVNGQINSPTTSYECLNKLINTEKPSNCLA